MQVNIHKYIPGKALHLFLKIYLLFQTHDLLYYAFLKSLDFINPNLCHMCILSNDFNKCYFIIIYVFYLFIRRHIYHTTIDTSVVKVGIAIKKILHMSPQTSLPGVRTHYTFF